MLVFGEQKYDPRVSFKTKVDIEDATARHGGVQGVYKNLKKQNIDASSLHLNSLSFSRQWCNKSLKRGFPVAKCVS